MSKTYEYLIIVHSRWRLIVCFSLLLCGIGAAMFELFQNHDKLIVCTSIIWIAISFFVSYWLSRGKIRIVLSEEGIKCNWERRFFLSFAKGWYASWRLIKSYFMYGDRSFDSFVLNFTNGCCFKFQRFNVFHIKDDYKKFISDFGEKANELMKQTDENSLGLKQCVDIFECEEYDEKALKRRRIICILSGIFLLLVDLLCLTDAIIHGSLASILVSIGWGVVLTAIFFYEYSALSNHNCRKK